MNERDRTYLQTPEQWTRFLSAFLHELRTPLASFRMLTDLLTEAPAAHLGDPERRYVENLGAVAQDLQVLVGEVSELTRLLAGRAQLRPEEVVLAQVVDQVEAAVRPRAWESGIALTESLDPALPRLFRTDRERFKQALVLLLDAAVSHAKSEVCFRLDIDEGELRIVISSDGSPFPEADPEVLFEPFQDGFRAARSHGGRSLALPLAKELARALGGTLRAQNRGGRPAFALAVPAAGS
ncbi:MAG TPA: HAMP domain-containing sensor histidine kinase [Thermoanaerobaculia bacterium]|jgi:signal transduction histidine kinase|nr:HAMP domain-containing sensor histidine kinase [Thermoanaerobaculia bacterium]